MGGTEFAEPVTPQAHRGDVISGETPGVGVRKVQVDILTADPTRIVLLPKPGSGPAVVPPIQVSAPSADISG